MKFDLIKTIIAVLFSALIAYGLSFCIGFKFNLLYPIVAFIELAVIMVTAMGLNVTWMQTMANIKIISWIFFFAALILNLIFALLPVTQPLFIIANGLLVLVFLLSVYSMAKARKEE